MKSGGEYTLNPPDTMCSLFSSNMVPPRGIEPRTSDYKTDRIPFTYRGLNWIWARTQTLRSAHRLDNQPSRPSIISRRSLTAAFIPATT